MLSSRAKTATKRAVAPLVRRLSSSRRDLPLSLWGLGRDAGGRLVRGGVPLESLLQQYGSPLHVVDVQRLDDNARAFLAAAPEIDAFFSYKTHPVTGVLRRLHAAGLGAEVISPHELRLALQLGVPPERIVYNGPGKTEASLREAAARGVLVNVNARPEIANLAEAARAAGVRARAGLRIVPPSAWSGQFGERLDTGAALRAAAELASCPDLRFEALHAHSGFELGTERRAADFAWEVLEFRARLRAELGVTVPIVDLGGSLPTATVRHYGALEKRLNRTFGADLVPRLPGNVLGPRAYIRLLGELLRAHAASVGGAPPRVLIEPGRAISGDAQLLLTRVLSLRDAEDGLITAVLDAGVNVAEPVRSEYHQIVPLTAGKPIRRYRLVGPICTPADVLCHSLRLPGIVQGEGLAILDSGAYFVPFATSFSFPQPAIVAWDQGDVHLVQRRESDVDMTARDVASGPVAVGHGSSHRPVDGRSVRGRATSS